VDFPLDAEVYCTEGVCGRSTTIIVNPTTEKVTHIGVRDADQAHTEYLVPVDMVASTTATSIHLSCTRAKLVGLEQFIETEYIEVWTPYYADELGYSYSGPQMVAVEHKLLPPGTLAVSRGMIVEATDGYVGTVDQLIVDPTSGQVTHFVLSKGHIWDEANVTLAVSHVDRVEGDTVYLRLNKESIELTPAVQARRLYSKEEINVMSIELVVVTFDDEDKAGKARQALQALNKKGIAEIRNMAVLVKEQDGKVKFTEAADVDARQGTLFGAVAGGLIGLLGGPAGVVIGAAAGAATGRVAAGKIDRGFSDEYLEHLQEQLKPGSSALVTLVEEASVEKLAEALASLNGQLARQPLTDEVVEQLLNQSASETGEDSPNKTV